jgi:hypothetical protein
LPQAAACLIALTSLPARAIIAAQEAPGTIGGVVESADQPARPLPHAIVSVDDPARAFRVSVVADDFGRFHFYNLAPGKYTVGAVKSGYLASIYGAKRAGGAGTPVALDAGARVDNLRVALARPGVIAGRVRDGSGAPAANIQIVVVSAGSAFGPAEYADRPDAILTDASGFFRTDQLAPDDYLIVAALDDGPGRRQIFRPTMAEVDASHFELDRRTSGETAAPVAGADQGLPNLQTYSWAPVYYPGTTDVQQARRVRVDPGTVRDDLDFAIDLAPLLTVAGGVVAEDGSPAPVPISITPVGPALPVARPGAPRSLISTWQQPDGGGRIWSALHFSRPGLTPGTYLLTATKNDGFWAAANVVVRDADVKDLRLVLQPPMSLAGRVVFEGGSTTPADPTSITIGLERVLQPSSVSTSPLLGVRDPPPAAVSADGTFALTAILPGTYVLRVADAASPPGRPRWWLESAMAGGRDLLDMPLEFGTRLHGVNDVVLRFSDRPAELSGRLLTTAGAPALDYAVVLVSADRAHWFAGARRSRAGRPATDGTFVISGLPAGNYWLAALTDAVPGVWDQPVFLDQVAAGALRVTIAVGAHVRQDVQIAGGR